MNKRLLAVWLSLALLITAADPLTVLADEAADPETFSVSEEQPAAEELAVQDAALPETETDSDENVLSVSDGETDANIISDGESAAGEAVEPSAEGEPETEDVVLVREADEALAEESLEQAAEPSVIYRTHVQSFGWQDPVRDGTMSGTQGKSKRLEGIEINVEGAEDLGIRYMTHIQTYGWETSWKENGGMSGTSGQSKRLEAIRIELTGADAAYFDVWYCVHAQHFGWLAWAKNGEDAGTAGYAYRLEGIKICILPKGSSAPANEGTLSAAFYSKSDGPSVNTARTGVAYNTHVQTYGWQDFALNGDMAGTSGQSKRLEGIHILLVNQPYSGGIEYRTHVQSYGWETTWKRNGQMSGTSGQAKRLEGIEIRLTGDMANHYDVYYQVHAQTYGWLGWAVNGQMAGTSGLSKRLEGIRIKLVQKGGAAPGSTAQPNVTAAAVAVATPTPSPAPSTVVTPTTYSYIGNRNSKIFHKSTCSSVSKMKDKNKVALSSREEAISLGYTPCKNCNP